MTDGYLSYELTHSSSRNTKPSQVPSNKSSDSKAVVAEQSTTQPSGKSVVYIQRKTSYSHTKYVHKPSKDSI